MIYLKQSTASQEVLLGPFVDSTDGVTAETALSIANTDIKVFKAGATTLANKNSGGATHISGGNYYAVLDATDTDTLGSGAIVVQMSGALAVRHDFCVLAANVYDSLIGSGDVLDVSVTQWTGTAVASPDTAGYPKVTLKSGTGTGEISLSSGRVALQNAPLTKNVAVPDWGFVMTDSTNHNPATSKTVTVYYSHDGGDTYTSLGTATESAAADGGYFIDISQAAMNADKIMLKMTAADCDTLWQLITTRA